MNTKGVGHKTANLMPAIVRFYAILLVFSLGACGGPLPISTYAPFSKSVLATRSYRIVEKAVSGKACDLMILGISTGDRSYAAALKDLHKKIKQKYGENVKEYVLINQVDDWNVRFYLLLLRVCTIITADVAVLGDLAPNVMNSTGKSKQKPPSLPEFPKPVVDIDLHDEEAESVLGGLTSAVEEAKGTATRESEGAENLGKKEPTKKSIPSATGGSSAFKHNGKAAAGSPARTATSAGSSKDESGLKYESLMARSRSYLTKGRKDLAVGAAMQARDIWFEGAQAQKLLGTIYMKSNDAKRAKKYYSEYLKLKPNAKDAKAISNALKKLEQKQKEDDMPVADDL